MKYFTFLFLVLCTPTYALDWVITNPSSHVELEIDSEIRRSSDSALMVSDSINPSDSITALGTADIWDIDGIVWNAPNNYVTYDYSLSGILSNSYISQYFYLDLESYTQSFANPKYDSKFNIELSSDNNHVCSSKYDIEVENAESNTTYRFKHTIVFNLRYDYSRDSVFPKPLLESDASIGSHSYLLLYQDSTNTTKFYVIGTIQKADGTYQSINDTYTLTAGTAKVIQYTCYARTIGSNKVNLMVTQDRGTSLLPYEVTTTGTDVNQDSKQQEIIQQTSITIDELIQL